MTRAKVKLNSYETRVYDHWEGGKIVGQYEGRTMKFTVVTSGSDENKTFFASTPSGQIELNIVAPDAWKNFELNKEYYVDFSPAA